jgi:hypothetical protein
MPLQLHQESCGREGKYLKGSVFWDITLCSLLKVNLAFSGLHDVISQKIELTRNFAKHTIKMLYSDSSFHPDLCEQKCNN